MSKKNSARRPYETINQTERPQDTIQRQAREFLQVRGVNHQLEADIKSQKNLLDEACVKIAKLQSELDHTKHARDMQLLATHRYEQLLRKEIEIQVAHKSLKFTEYGKSNGR